MRNQLKTIFLAASFTIIAGNGAQAAASCELLDALVKDMDLLADALEESDYQPDNTLDLDLRTLVIDARDIAEDENDQRAIDAVNGMIDGLNDGDADLYLRSSDDLAARFEYLFDRDC